MAEPLPNQRRSDENIGRRNLDIGNRVGVAGIHLYFLVSPLDANRSTIDHRRGP